MREWPVTIGLLAHTVRHLRVTQVVNRLTRKFCAPRLDLTPAPPRRAPTQAPSHFLARPVTLSDGWHFDLLNRSRTIRPAEFSAKRSDLLWEYHFHYFDGLLAEEPDFARKQMWIDAWIEEIEPGSRPAWDPYPVSRRVLNWIKWSIAHGPPKPMVLDSLAAQVRYLSGSLEYHLLANHLLANAVALTAAGAFFNGSEGEKWREQGERILTAQLAEQFLKDGGHFELSPTYHALMLEDLLDLLRIGEVCGVPEVPGLRATASLASGWLERMTRPDGRTPLFNDAGDGMASDSAALTAYAGEFGLVAHEAPEPGRVVLLDSGYFRFDSGRLHLIGDVGPPGPRYQPGHAHCDMLSFEVSWAGEPLIVDTGTSTYEAGPMRCKERGTAAHNTVQIGRLEQSEIWAAFRMARRGRVDSVEWSDDRVKARIIAFPPHWLQHEREWRFEGEQLVITDRIPHHAADQPATARLHFHPRVKLRLDGNGWRAGGVRVDFEGASEVQIRPFEYAPEFNRRIPAELLEARFSGTLVTRLSP